MKTASFILAALALAAGAGCAHMGVDTTPESDPNRVVTGTVETGEAIPLPADAVVNVRVVDQSRSDLPPQVLGDQEIRSPGATPIPFSIEFRAEDDVMRRGLNLEARISFGHTVRYFNVSQVAVNLRNAADPHRILVNPSAP